MIQNKKEDHFTSPAADFSGYLKQENNSILLNNNLKLKKRVYEAEDWDGFRTAVNTHKSYGKELILEKIK